MNGDEDGVEPTVGIDLETEIEVRVDIIGSIARNVGQATRADPQHLAMIKKGFTAKVLREVELIAVSADGQVLSYAKVSVDWSQYAVELSRPSANRLTIDTKSSVSGQIAPTLDPIIAYIKGVSADLAIDHVKVLFTFRPERREEGSKLLGTSPMDDDTRAMLKSAKFVRLLEGQDRNLSELSIMYKHVEVPPARNATGVA